MVLLKAPVNSAGSPSPNCPFSALLSPLGSQSLTGGSPDLPAAPGALAASCLSWDPHTSTFPDGRHVRDGTVDGCKDEGISRRNVVLKMPLLCFMPDCISISHYFDGTTHTTSQQLFSLSRLAVSAKLKISPQNFGQVKLWDLTGPFQHPTIL